MPLINPDSFIQNCLAAALFSTTAAVGMKHAFNSSLPHLLKGYICDFLNLFMFWLFKVESCQTAVAKILPILQFCCMMPLNTKALQHTLRAMHLATTSQAVLTNLAFSFVLGGLIGYFIFNEAVNLQWWIGIATVLTGVYLLSITKTDVDKKSNKVTVEKKQNSEGNENIIQDSQVDSNLLKQKSE